MGISLLRPSLPPAAALLPYLARIDQARLYSNFGPLALDLEARIAERLGLPTAGVSSLANATVGLTAALLAQNPAPGSFCLMPAWTFIATPLAAIAAGMQPYFLDVDAADWTLTPSDCDAAMARLGDRVGAVMPVSPFGLPASVPAWEAFHDRTGLAVVIDAAAAFDATTAGRIPSVISLHATKALGCGEGGLLLCRDAELVRRARSYLGFGFLGSRDARVPGFNGKMSEYHAAVALAALDSWPATRAALVARAEAYRAAFACSNQVRLQQGFGEEWIAATCVVELPEGSASTVEQALQAAGTDTRRWWGEGAHRHTATAGMQHAPLPVTARLAGSSIGLPFYVDMPLAEIATVAQQVLAALDR
jgi:dTDP-4-amino-4,6-dideoxygalactose transaminase